MNKPFAILKNELIDKIINAINTSELDIGVVELIMRDIMREISQISEREAKRQIDSYNASFTESETTTAEPVEDAEFEEV